MIKKYRLTQFLLLAMCMVFCLACNTGVEQPSTVYLITGENSNAVEISTIRGGAHCKRRCGNSE